jgi:hypothetical protein
MCVFGYAGGQGRRINVKKYSKYNKEYSCITVTQYRRTQRVDGTRISVVLCCQELEYTRVYELEGTLQNSQQAATMPHPKPD